MFRILLLLLIISLSPHLQAEGKILVFGDSLSAGFGLLKGEGWVDLLEKKLSQQKTNYSVVNASISGDTTNNGLLRLPQALTANKPDIVILELGANDGLRGLNLKSMKNNLSEMIDLCLQSKSKVLLVGMQLPPNYGPFYVNAFQQNYSDLAKEKNIPLIPFLMDGFESDLSYFQNDRIHPNAKAQKIITQTIWQTLSTML